MIRITLADDHRLFRSGLQKILSGQGGLEVVSEAGDGLELLQQIDEFQPDLVIVDISMPNLGGIEATREIKSRNQAIKVMVLTMHKDVDYLQSAIDAGADGYMLKEDADDALFTAINTILSGKNYISPSLTSEFSDSLVKIMRGEKKDSAEVLTPRETSVLKLIAQGKTSKEIGGLLFISPRTVEHHRANTMKKLGFKTLADLMKYAIKKGY